MTMDALKYSNYDIVFQEVPGEVTLAINLTGCPHRCSGCHSPYLWEYFGDTLLDNLETLISRYDGLITCVCFMGGDQNMGDMFNALIIVKNHKLKTAIYSGSNSIETFYDVLHLLDYLKIGSYMDNLGGLSSKETNQRFYCVAQGVLHDTTAQFQSK